MLRLFLNLFQLFVLAIIIVFAFTYSNPVSFAFNDVIITTPSYILIAIILIVIAIILLFQKFLFFLRQTSQKYKFYRKDLIHTKGYNSFIQGMVALANKDFKRALTESRNINKYFKDETLGLLLKSETLKIEKRFDELNQVYEKMIKNPDTSLLGLRGLMEQNLRAQDYHHALVYGEKLFKLNPQIDKLYETLVTVISKTHNWHKLLKITDQSLRYKIIDKNIFNKNKSIAFYEIAKIKHANSEKESINLMEKAIKLDNSFQPLVSYYVQLLLNNNNLQKAKKVLITAWSINQHPNLKNEIKLFADKSKISYSETVKQITSKTSSYNESIILLTEAFIEEKKWEKAREQIKVLLTHQPTKEVCLLMAKIEEGASGDPQKINSWVSRSNFGKLSKIWVCQISGVSQLKWSSLSKGGYFNALIWEYPKNINELISQDFDLEENKYIGN